MRSERWWREFEKAIGAPEVCEEDELSYDHSLMLFLDAMMVKGLWKPSDPDLFASDCESSMKDELLRDVFEDVRRYHERIRL